MWILAYFNIFLVQTEVCYPLVLPLISRVICKIHFDNLFSLGNYILPRLIPNMWKPLFHVFWGFFFVCFRFFGHESKSGSCYSILAGREGNLILFNLIFSSISWTSSGFRLSINKLESVTFKLGLVASPWPLLLSSRYTSFCFIIRHFHCITLALPFMIWPHFSHGPLSTCSVANPNWHGYQCKIHTGFQRFITRK